MPASAVSKFSKVSLFSGLNNLNDISIDALYRLPIHLIGVDFSREQRSGVDSR